MTCSLLALLAAGSGCATSFRGDAHISAADCNANCREMGGEMSAYVFMGQYSTACVCTPPGRSGQMAGAAGGQAGAVAGVWMQMQEAERQRQR
ncbi:MAG: hypothetical protein VYE22_02640 [Myxococcota bacterium]|nr:hypothetical protein [Myxococcota bacterium]